MQWLFFSQRLSRVCATFAVLWSDLINVRMWATILFDQKQTNKNYISVFLDIHIFLLVFSDADEDFALAKCVRRRWCEAKYRQSRHCGRIILVLICHRCEMLFNSLLDCRTSRRWRSESHRYEAGMLQHQKHRRPAVSLNSMVWKISENSIQTPDHWSKHFRGFMFCLFVLFVCWISVAHAYCMSTGAGQRENKIGAKVSVQPWLTLASCENS